MKHEAEIELKMLVSEEQFYQLASFYQPLNFVEQHNYYYVTNDIKHYAYRVREKEGTLLFTLKEHSNGQVIEHEKYLNGPLEEDEEVKELLASFGIYPPYKLIGELITERAVVEDEYAELCFDINHYNGITDYEIEYEIKQAHDYKKAFKKLLKKASLKFVENKESKYKRCLKSLPDDI